MQLAYNNNEAVPMSEMAIVNTFTKLIFGEATYTARELSIIDGFRAVDADVLRDSHEEMGEYLRNLGVREMIQLVSRLHLHLTKPGGTHSSRRGSAPPALAPDAPGMERNDQPR
jgi:hypothetical protein